MLSLFLLAACTHEPEHPGLQPQLYADQEGQEVRLTVEIFDGGDPGLEARYDLVHMEDAGEERFLLRRHRFDPTLAEAQGSACIDCGYDDTGMSEDPCESGDGDRGDCVSWYRFGVTDPCQDAGQTSYELRLAGEEDAITVESFYVVDMGAACEKTGCASAGSRGSLGMLGMLGLAGLARRRRSEPRA